MAKVLFLKIKCATNILSFCTFDLEVLVYNKNDGQNVLKKSVLGQIILS